MAVVSLVAFILAVLALLLSLAALLVSRAAYRLEADRRRDELTPTLTVEPNPDRTRVRLRNVGRQDLSRVKLWLTPPDDPSLPVVTALRRDGYVSTSLDLPPMMRGGSHEIELVLPDEGRGGPVHLRCDCYGAAGDWTVMVAFDVPPEPRISVW